jgi:hyaluronate lyase
VTLGPTADAYVRDGTWAATNFGTSTWLFTKTANTGQNQDAYLKFDTSSIGGVGSVASAKLRVNAEASANANVGMTIYAVSNTTWSESAITWNNKPARGGPLASTTVTGNSCM